MKILRKYGLHYDYRVVPRQLFVPMILNGISSSFESQSCPNTPSSANCLGRVLPCSSVNKEFSDKCWVVSFCFGKLVLPVIFFPEDMTFIKISQCILISSNVFRRHFRAVTTGTFAREYLFPLGDFVDINKIFTFFSV